MKKSELLLLTKFTLAMTMVILAMAIDKHLAFYVMASFYAIYFWRSGKKLKSFKK